MSTKFCSAEALSSKDHIAELYNRAGHIGNMFRGAKGETAFYPNEHLRSDRWKNMRYSTKPDYKFLWAEESDRARLQPSRLSHVTTFTGAQGIFSSRTFSSNTPKNIGVDTYFSWWSFDISKRQKKRKRDKYRKIMKANARPSDTIHKFFKSPPFEEGSRYGNFKFTYDMESLFEMYENSVCGGRRAEFRVLGTFTYKQEVMHAVVVCPPSDVAPLFSSYPPVGNDTRAVVSKSNQGWMWRPDSTRYNYCCWDHVSFAFHLPRGNPGFQLPPEYPQVTYCKESRNLFRPIAITPEEEFDECLEILQEIWEESG